ncbi:Synapse-associated protein 1 [Geranomyces variabilis]|nr:Synapse-associated protein 1 [Geranomyces variabilis]
MLSRAFSYAAKIKTAVVDAADSFDHEQKTWLDQKRSQDGAGFSEAAEESLTSPVTAANTTSTATIPTAASATIAPLLAPATETLKKTGDALLGIINKAIPDPSRLLAGWEETDATESRQSAAARKGLADAGADHVAMPWDGAENPEALKSHVLALSNNKDAFLEPMPENPPGFVFDLEAAYPTIIEMLRLDTRLGQLRFELVPKKMKEPQFWRTYFWRICQLRADPASAIPLAPLPSADSELLFTAPEVDPPSPDKVTTNKTGPENASANVTAAPVAIPVVDNEAQSPNRGRSSIPRVDSHGSLPTAQDLRDEQPAPAAPKDLADAHSFDGYVPEEFVSDMYEPHDDEWQDDEPEFDQ